jgi:hypothetical protein
MSDPKSIVEWATHALRDQRVALLNLCKQDPNIKIIEHLDGCRINLDTLTVDQIAVIHSHIQSCHDEKDDFK